MSDSYGQLSDGSAARVVWYIAVNQPVTVQEIADGIGVDKSGLDNRVVKFWRNGLLIRREDPDYTKSGGQPYEYAIRVPETNE